MIAFFLMMLFVLLYQAFLNAMVVLVHAESSVFLVGPIVLVLAIFCFSLLEGLWALLFAGILIDSLTGSLIGANMVLLVILGGAGMLASSWLGKPHWPMIGSFLLVTSLVYRVAMAQFGNWGFLNLLLGPVADTCFGLMLFYGLPRRVIRMD